MIELLYKAESKYISITFWLKLKGRNERNPELGQASSQFAPLCIRSRGTSPSFLRLSHKLHFVCLHGNFFFSAVFFSLLNPKSLQPYLPFASCCSQPRLSFLCFAMESICPKSHWEPGVKEGTRPHAPDFWTSTLSPLNTLSCAMYILLKEIER